jgi:arginase
MKPSDFEIIGAPFDLGSPARGCATAPGALREKGLVRRLQRLGEVGRHVVDSGDVSSPRPSEDPSTPKHLPELVQFSSSLMERVRRCYRSGRQPVVVGGDHSISIGSVSAAAEHVRDQHGLDAHLGLLWVDAHPDLETPEASPSSDLHGMSVAHLMGYGVAELCDLGGFRPKVRPEHVVFVGLRDVVACEREMIGRHNMAVYTSSDVERLGIVEVCRRAFTHLADKTAGFVVSFDMDACNPVEAPGVQYPTPGGLTYRESQVLMEFASNADGLVSVELVEVDPTRDATSTTVTAAIDLIRTALGGRTI